eukprot:1158317-Pelagomonas_calceolata.AAC.9
MKDIFKSRTAAGPCPMRRAHITLELPHPAAQSSHLHDAAQKLRGYAGLAQRREWLVPAMCTHVPSELPHSVAKAVPLLRLNSHLPLLPASHQD